MKDVQLPALASCGQAHPGLKTGMRQGTTFILVGNSSQYIKTGGDRVILIRSLFCFCLEYNFLDDKASD